MNNENNTTYHRPSWDEYFMEIANTVSKRATCDRGRSGCVIVRDRQILVTGYVGSPKGLPHCDEVGHQFNEWFTKTEPSPSIVFVRFMRSKMPSVRRPS